MKCGMVPIALFLVVLYPIYRDRVRMRQFGPSETVRFLTSTGKELRFASRLFEQASIIKCTSGLFLFLKDKAASL
jgi:hypothetical protein